MAYVPKTRTVTENVKEWISDEVDWSYEFEPDANGDRMAKRINRLRQCEAGVGRAMATRDGGWPRIGWGVVEKVGMAAQWPYWRPRPTVLIHHLSRFAVFPYEWLDWQSVSDVRDMTAEDTPCAT